MSSQVDVGASECVGANVKLGLGDGYGTHPWSGLPAPGSVHENPATPQSYYTCVLSTHVQ